MRKSINTILCYIPKGIKLSQGVNVIKLGNAEIIDTFAELFPMWGSRLLITAANEKWARTAAQVATGFASSIIMSPAEAGIERFLSPDETPDGRPGVIIHVYHKTRIMLRAQILARIGQCVLTCPTTATFDAIPEAKRKLKIGNSLRMFGDGFETNEELYGRNVWRIPVMEGDYLIEDLMGTKKAAAGGNLLILAKNWESGLKASEDAVEAIKKTDAKVVLPFPGGICRSGSKVGSLKYKLAASTNHLYCPSIRDKVPDTKIPEGVHSVYELVINGMSLNDVSKAMKAALHAAAKVDGVVQITAANYGGKLGKMKVYLKDLL